MSSVSVHNTCCSYSSWRLIEEAIGISFQSSCFSVGHTPVYERKSVSHERDELEITRDEGKFVRMEERVTNGRERERKWDVGVG
jgi:hypothetical protein